jgi:hypothetical protein
MIDANGQSLPESFTTSFSVGPPNREPIDPRQWTLSLPPSGTRQPLSVSFPVPLGRALMSRAITVIGAGQMPITGDIMIDGFETRWTFTPTKPWVHALYHLAIEQTLEDVSGNTAREPFDVDARKLAALRGAPKLMSLAFAPCPREGVYTHPSRGPSCPETAEVPGALGTDGQLP